MIMTPPIMCHVVDLFDCPSPPHLQLHITFTIAPSLVSFSPLYFIILLSFFFALAFNCFFAITASHASVLQSSLQPQRYHSRLFYQILISTLHPSLGPSCGSSKRSSGVATSLETSFISFTVRYLLLQTDLKCYIRSPSCSLLLCHT